ncbi:hypothetical protein ACFFMR_32480 [Micromonospora andamanensis]|uniref:Multidrug ABC transporter ATPase n=1 Tax=Micromonospora andamanensis TaxID=1287068 RepID=A0ABQ4I225_9ACTN|nr:hypothetical protein [Micromonospora andamanensis]GIJ11925.1 hypothetical protein Van01_51390 [Micromonospora andamanensis]
MVTLAVGGALSVLAAVVLSILNWPSVNGFAGRLDSGWSLFMIACYAPVVLWPPLLLSVTWAYVRRRRYRLNRGGD